MAESQAPALSFNLPDPKPEKTLDKYPPPENALLGLYREPPSDKYVLEWNGNDVSLFCKRMLAECYKTNVTELVIKGSMLDYDPGDILRLTICTSKINKVRVTWDAEILVKEGQDGQLPEEASVRVMVHVLNAIKGTSELPSPVLDLVLERVPWKLFDPERRILFSSRLKHLTLLFDSSGDYGNETYRKEMGIALRIDSLQALSLHFKEMPRQSGSHTQGELLPPDFGCVVEDSSCLPELRELTLENATIQSESAKRFFIAHKETLDKVSLLSMWNHPEIASAKSVVGRGLRKAKLKELRLRGTWMHLLAADGLQGPNRSVLVWNEENNDDLQAMMRAEWRILKKNKDAVLTPGLDPKWVDPQATRWQQIRQFWEDLFDQKIRDKKNKVVRCKVCGLKKCKIPEVCALKKRRGSNGSK